VTNAHQSSLGDDRQQSAQLSCTGAAICRIALKHALQNALVTKSPGKSNPSTKAAEDFWNEGNGHQHPTHSTSMQSKV